MASTYLSDTYASTGNRRIFTHSFWIKRNDLGGSGATKNVVFHAGFGSGSGDYDFICFNSDSLQVAQLNSADTAYAYNLYTSAVYRDVNSWYHMVITFDTTQATASDRLKIWINGVQVTSFATGTYPSQNFETQVNVGTNPLRVGRGTNTDYVDALMAHYHFIDGTAYDASTFGESDANGVWKPKTSPSVTYGTNGFFLKFENSGSMGTDSSGNGNNFTVSGTLTQTLDTPSNVYATLNPLNHIQGTFLNGNTVLEAITTSADSATSATLGFTKGKWYWEGKVNFIKGTGGSADMIGILDSSATLTISNNNVPNGYGFNAETGVLYNGTTAVISGLSTASNGDIYGVGYDADNGDLYLWKNGVAENSGNAIATGIDTSVTWVPYFVNHYGSTNSHSWQINFGNGYFATTAVSSAGSNGNGSIFEYDVPTGFYALNTKNIAQYG